MPDFLFGLVVGVGGTIFLVRYTLSKGLFPIFSFDNRVGNVIVRQFVFPTNDLPDINNVPELIVAKFANCHGAQVNGTVVSDLVTVTITCAVTDDNRKTILTDIDHRINELRGKPMPRFIKEIDESKLVAP